MTGRPRWKWNGTRSVSMHRSFMLPPQYIDNIHKWMSEKQCIFYVQLISQYGLKYKIHMDSLQRSRPDTCGTKKHGQNLSSRSGDTARPQTFGYDLVATMTLIPWPSKPDQFICGFNYVNSQILVKFRLLSSEISFFLTKLSDALKNAVDVISDNA